MTGGLTHCSENPQISFFRVFVDTWSQVQGAGELLFPHFYLRHIRNRKDQIFPPWPLFLCLQFVGTI